MNGICIACKKYAANLVIPSSKTYAICSACEVQGETPPDYCVACGMDYDAMTEAERALHGVDGEYIVFTCAIPRYQAIGSPQGHATFRYIYVSGKDRAGGESMFVCACGMQFPGRASLAQHHCDILRAE